jgi:general stress protein CsbA
MAKVTAWLVTLIGVLLILPLIGVTALKGAFTDWVIALGVLVIGIGKLMRNYQKKKR